MTVIIIGAGVVGCAIAHELASRGARVSVVDPRGAGAGATRASAGILAPYIEGHSPELLQLTLRSLTLYDAFIARLRERTGQAPEYERTGTLEIARDAAHAEVLQRTARQLRDAGVAHVWCDAAAAHALEPALAESVIAAVSVPSQGYVAASRLTALLAAAAEGLGVTFVNERVDWIERGRVRTATATLEADAVVIAAGSWSSGLRGALHPVASAVRPIRGQLVALHAATRPAARVIWASSCYLVPWRDGSVLVGATSEDVGFDEQSTAAGVRQMVDAAIGVLPVLSSAEFREVRVGLRPKTRDELPAIGPSSTIDGVFYATGHYRNGVLLAPLTAALVGDLVMEGRAGAELALTTPERLGL